MSSSKTIKLDGHTNSRGKVCVVCLGKSKFKLTPNLISQLNQFTQIFDKISSDDERAPSAICGACRHLLQDKVKGKGQNKTFKFPLDFRVESNVIIVEKSEGACVCTICKIASGLDGVFSKTNQPKNSGPKKSSKVESKKLCDECLGVFSPGISHVCNDHTTLENLKLFLQRKLRVLPKELENYQFYMGQNYQ